PRRSRCRAPPAAACETRPPWRPSAPRRRTGSRRSRERGRAPGRGRRVARAPPPREGPRGRRTDRSASSSCRSSVCKQTSQGHRRTLGPRASCMRFYLLTSSILTPRDMQEDPMADTLDILVTGATGTQGGAVARQLVKNGHRVRALTRNVASPAAQALAALGSDPAQGNREDRASVDRALADMEAMFSVATPYEHGAEAERRQSILAADAAAAAGAFLVYSSVANADRRTGIPHFDGKF